MIHLYVTVIAFGGGLIGKKDWETLERESRIRHYEPSAFSVKSTLYASDGFRVSHAGLYHLLKHVTSRPGCQWRLVDNAESADYVVKDTVSLHTALSQLRRLGKQVPGQHGRCWNFGVAAILAKPPRKRKDRKAN